jgi:hypothetical protein
MDIKTKSSMRLLALARTPKSGRSILDWNPFNQRTLGKIIDDHNQQCIAEYLRRGWVQDDIEAMVQTIDIVLSDLSNVGELRVRDYRTIGIVVLDLNEIDRIKTKLNNIKYQISAYRHPFHLPQISQVAKAVSAADSFRPLPFLSTDPEIMRTEPEFEAFLGKLCYFYRTAINTLRTASPPPDTPPDDPALQGYIDGIPNLAANVRDAAVARGLTKNETIILAQRASAQELILNRLAEQIRSGERHKIRVAGVREKVFDISVEPLEKSEVPLEDVNLVRLDLEHSMRSLRTAQRGDIVSLGLRRKGHTGIFFDEPSLWRRVELLGSAVKATRFSAQLPRWTSLTSDKDSLRGLGGLESGPSL